MKKLSQMLESINEVDSIVKELEFKTPAEFATYKKKHKMRPGTVVKVAGKDKVIDDPKKNTKPKGNKTADTLTKGLKDGGLNPYKDGPLINQALDDIGGDHSDLKKRIDTYGDNVPSSKGKSEAQYQKEIDKYKEEGEKLSNDIADAVSDKPKGKKTKSKPMPQPSDFGGDMDKYTAALNKRMKDDEKPKGKKPKGDEKSSSDKPDIDPKTDKEMSSAVDAANEKMAKAEFDDAVDFSPSSVGDMIDRNMKNIPEDERGTTEEAIYALQDAEMGMIGDEDADWAKEYLKDTISKYIKEGKNSDLRQLSKITTRYTNRLDERSTLTLRGKNGKMVDVPRKFASIISGIDRLMSKFNPRGVMFGHRKYHKLKPNDEYSGSIVLKNPLSKKDIDDVMKQLKRTGSSLGIKFEKITFNPDRNEPFIEFRVNNASFK